ncbi:hypothetical protein B0T18DRAFT_20876 [Schizothecium vesticola]|uniref:Uncharacterized protein n=1 Tax=Schizothecium vesticola TaxID=314040 RepID=A0AA40F9H5_9PEZI|nr:hypothetical protein B0T18DRAFT_20876 [Schizothecium vesticola]
MNSRGWTLQELIVPTIAKFFSVEGVFLGDKQFLRHQIHNATGIPLGALQGNTLSDFSIEARMSWAKERKTTAWLSATNLGTRNFLFRP